MSTADDMKVGPSTIRRDRLNLSIRVDTSGVNAALKQVGRAIAEFARTMAAGPRRSRLRAQYSSPQPLRYGTAYRARARRRTRRNR